MKIKANLLNKPVNFQMDNCQMFCKLIQSDADSQPDKKDKELS